MKRSTTLKMALLGAGALALGACGESKRRSPYLQIGGGLHQRRGAGRIDMRRRIRQGQGDARRGRPALSDILIMLLGLRLQPVLSIVDRVVLAAVYGRLYAGTAQINDGNLCPTALPAQEGPQPFLHQRRCQHRKCVHHRPRASCQVANRTTSRPNPHGRSRRLRLPVDEFSKLVT